MKTEGLQQFQYGRIEARIKLTVGDGLWPAFWMLGTNINSVGWPNCGESDIMEWVPQYTATTTSSTDHGPGYSGGSGIGARYIFPNNGQVDDPGYHTYGVVWSPYKMQFYRDDWKKPFLTVTPNFIPAGSQWVFNHPFFILLNQAIGGNFPKPGPDNSTPSPADMLVDTYECSLGMLAHPPPLASCGRNQSSAIKSSSAGNLTRTPGGSSRRTATTFTPALLRISNPRSTTWWFSIITEFITPTRA